MRQTLELTKNENIFMKTKLLPKFKNSIINAHDVCLITERMNPNKDKSTRTRKSAVSTIFERNKKFRDKEYHVQGKHNLKIFSQEKMLN